MLNTTGKLSSGWKRPLVLAKGSFEKGYIQEPDYNSKRRDSAGVVVVVCFVLDLDCSWVPELTNVYSFMMVET